MLSDVYTHKLSAWRNLANLLKDAPRAETLSSGHTFYRGKVEVARLYNYLSGPTQIEIDEEHFLLKRQKRVVLFTQNYTLERDGRALATASAMSGNFIGSEQVVSGGPTSHTVIRGHWRQ